MKRFLMTMAVVCVLSSSALAGDIPSDGVASPAPQASSPVVVAIVLAIISVVGK